LNMAKRWDVLTDTEREDFLTWLQPRLLPGVQVKSRVDVDITHDRRAVRRIIAMFGEVGWTQKAALEELEREVDARVADVQHDVHSVPRAGDKIPHVKLLDVQSSRELSLADEVFTDKVLVIDFWATWSGPCEASMHASHEIISRRASDWAGGVVFMAISLDKSAGTVRERARERGWENALHLWCGPQTWRSEAATTLGIDGVPFMLVVGRNGCVAYRGPPHEVELEKLVDECVNSA